MAVLFSGRQTVKNFHRRQFHEAIECTSFHSYARTKIISPIVFLISPDIVFSRKKEGSRSDFKIPRGLLFGLSDERSIQSAECR